MAEIYRNYVAPLINGRDSEKWHTYARNALTLAESNPITLRLVELFAAEHKRYIDPKLKIRMADMEFENPVMVGPGWDKIGGAENALYSLGFAGVEIGTVLPDYQAGNKKPRQHGIGDTVINNIGLYSPGLEVVVKKINKYGSSNTRKTFKLGISIGQNNETHSQNSPQSFAKIVKATYEFADYFDLNPECPNVENKEIPLEAVVECVLDTMDLLGERKPIFIKVGPDSRRRANRAIRIVNDYKLAGIEATNTTINAEIKAKYGEKWRNTEGGLSGNDEDFRNLSTRMISFIRKEAGNPIEIIGVGGVSNWEHVVEKMEAGARVVQVVTAIRSEGPAVAGKINRGLVAYMDKEGIRNISEIVGTAA